MNKKAGLAILVGLGVIGFAAAAAAEPRKKQLPPPEPFDDEEEAEVVSDEEAAAAQEVEPIDVPATASAATQAAAGTAQAAWNTLTDLLKSEPAEIVQKVGDALKSGTVAPDLPPHIQTATQAAKQTADELDEQAAADEEEEEVGAPNPAAVACHEAGGTYDPNGSMCELPDGSRVSAWQLLKEQQTTTTSPGFVPPDTFEPEQAVATVADKIAQATPEAQEAAAEAADAIAKGEPISGSTIAKGAGLLAEVLDTAKQTGLQVPDQIVDALESLPDEEEAPPEAKLETSMPEDTAELLSVMLAVEQAPNWKRKEPLLAPWQRDRGLVADQMFGQKSALAMAEETGLLPIVRYWPTGTYRDGRWLDDYRAKLLAIAETAEEPRASQLREAAKREQGQGWAPVQPITKWIDFTWIED